MLCLCIFFSSSVLLLLSILYEKGNFNNISSAVYESTNQTHAVSVKAHHSTDRHINLDLPQSLTFSKPQNWVCQQTSSIRFLVPHIEWWNAYTSFLFLTFSAVHLLLWGELQKLPLIISNPAQRNLSGLIFLWNTQLCLDSTRSILILWQCAFQE